jgi:hypothetical protein
MASPILPGRENSALVFTLLVNENKTTTKNFKEDKKTFDRFFGIVGKNTVSKTQKKESIKIAKRFLPRMNKKTKQNLGFSQFTPKTFVGIFSIPWFKDLLNSYPELIITKLKCPILGIYGSKDVQVPIQNAEALKIILDKSDNDQHKIKIIKNTNHLFQNCQTGYPSEYLKNPKTMIPEVLVLIEKWISKIDNKK